MSAWQPFRPSPQTPWDLRRVAHLHRRVVFGGTWAEYQRDRDGSPADAIDRVLTGNVRLDGVPDEFDTLADTIGLAAVQHPDPRRLKAWWMYRFLFTSGPLQERLALMWHSHFATSNRKVDNVLHMWQQNNTIRRHARGSFDDLLRALLQDPALLQWLDAPTNRRGQAPCAMGPVRHSRTR